VAHFACDDRLILLGWISSSEEGLPACSSLIYLKHSGIPGLETLMRAQSHYDASMRPGPFSFSSLPPSCGVRVQRHVVSESMAVSEMEGGRHAIDGGAASPGGGLT
jgi:hypothetical protein